MKLVTKKMEKEIPRLYEDEETSVNEKMIYAKFFLPGTACTWLVAEMDKKSGLFFGWVTLGFGPSCDEWGTFSLQQLLEETNQFGLGVERDLSWTPKKFKDIVKGVDY